nr:MAG TPA: hypothetical protein [Caudoviricetes sp.]
MTKFQRDSKIRAYQGLFSFFYQFYQFYPCILFNKTSHES